MFSSGSTAGTLVCRAADGSRDLTREQERAYQALSLIRRLKFDAPLPWTTESLWAWFTARVHRIEYVTGQISYFGSGGTIYAAVPSTAAPPGFPTDVFGLVHEARHADVPHTCGSGRDHTIAERGAFGVQYHFALWTADHAVAPPLTTEDRSYARQVAAQLEATASAFCTPCGGL